MSSRSRLTFGEGLRLAEREAWRTYGRRHPFWFAFGRYIGVAVLWLSVAGLLMAGWYLIPHAVLGGAALAFAVAPLIVFGVRAVSRSGLHNRLMARARGESGNPRARIAFAGYTLLMLGASWLSLMSPWA